MDLKTHVTTPPSSETSSDQSNSPEYGHTGGSSLTPIEGTSSSSDVYGKGEKPLQDLSPPRQEGEPSSNLSLHSPAPSASPLLKKPPVPITPAYALHQEDARVADDDVLDEAANDFFDLEEESHNGGVLSWNASFILNSIQQMIPEKQTFDEEPATPLFFPTSHHHNFFDADETVVEEEERLRAAGTVLASGRQTTEMVASAGTAKDYTCLANDRHIPYTSTEVDVEGDVTKEGKKDGEKEGVDARDVKKEDGMNSTTSIRIVNSIAYPPYGVKTKSQKNLLFWGHSLPLYSIMDVPHWQRYNTAIRGNYRAFYDTTMILKSLVGWHNESMNVWTHLAGFLFFIYLSNYLFSNVIRSDGALSPYLYQAPVFYYIFCVGCLGCTICSTVFHLFSGHRDGKLITLMGRIDFIGITLLIISSLLPPVYVLLHCLPLYRNLYITASVMLGVFTSVACWTDTFYENVYLRVGLFVGLSISGAGPLVHILCIVPHTATISSIIYGMALMGALYLTGVCFYVVRFPEAWFPSHFDCFFSSHQIWHYFVLLASLVHFCNCTSMYQIYTMSDGSC